MSRRRERRARNKDQGEDYDQIFNDTVVEVILLVLIVMSFGLFATLRKSSTDKSLIHRFFRPFDSFMHDPSLDIDRRRKSVHQARDASRQKS